MKTRTIILICVAILVAGSGLTAFIFMTEPTAQSEGASKQMAMLVEVVPAEAGDFSPVLTATGTVEPVEDILLSPRVSGQVIMRAPDFVPGGFVPKGNTLLQIDPSDYRNTLQVRKSQLEQRETDLAMEMGRQQVARQDLQLVGGDSLSPEERSLVLRKPQLHAVKADITAARSAVEQARLDLARTTITAPFDAHVIRQNVTVGSQVAPGDDLGRLVGVDHYWVRLNLPVNQLRWIRFSRTDTSGASPVRIYNRTAWGEESFREGILKQQVGALDERTRLATVLVEVPDPMARTQAKTGKPPLIIGSFVEARITGNELQNVVRIPREYLRTGNTVWIKKEGQLQVRKADVILTDQGFAYLRAGVEDGEQVITTNLSTVTEGTPVRTEATKNTGEAK